MSVWSESKRMLVVTPFSSVNNLKDYKEAIKDLGLNVNECEILAVTESKKESLAQEQLSSVTFLSDKEIGLFGKVKSDHARKVLNETYDILAVSSDITKKIAKTINVVNHKYSVGINSNVDFLTIKLNVESAEPKRLLTFVKQILEKIN